MTAIYIQHYVLSFAKSHRIVGGSASVPHSWPWQVSLRNSSKILNKLLSVNQSFILECLVSLWTKIMIEFYNCFWIWNMLNELMSITYPICISVSLYFRWKSPLWWLLNWEQFHHNSCPLQTYTVRLVGHKYRMFKCTGPKYYYLSSLLLDCLESSRSLIEGSKKTHFL